MGDVDESNIIHVIFRKKQTDGGKYRILRRRKVAKEDLTMDHADPGLCPVILTPALYEAAKEMGEDMTGYAKQELIPV